MQFRSTRGTQPVGLDEALSRGIAQDGGLFLPTDLPQFTTADFAGSDTAQAIADILLAPFFATSTLRDDLSAIVQETLHFPLPLVELNLKRQNAWLMELFHGPTAAFKDVGAAFLAACLSRLQQQRSEMTTILVATSGDTGGAVAAAFDGRPNVRVVVLFPAGRVSARQAKQLTCWGDNVLSLQVDGSFDDCQALVKAAFVDSELASAFRFSSANSINIGRLLPQSTYYAYASLLHWRARGEKPNFIVPTGNLGNALACVLARDMGLPIGEIVLATNANRLISDYLGGTEWLPRASIATLATAMDVGNPSNMERLRSLHGEGQTLGGVVTATSVADAEIEAEIKLDFAELGMPICPHTATGMHALRQLPEDWRDKDWIVVATAHPAKFESIVEPLIGETVAVPNSLATILSRESRYQTIEPTLDALADALKNWPVG